MKLKQFLFTLAVMLSSFVMSVNAQVAKIGSTEYVTLQAALAAAQDGDVVTLLADNDEEFNFEQNDGKVTIDGDGKTFTGKITLNGGSGELVFTKTTLTPSSRYTIVLNADKAPNVTIDDCIMKNTGTEGCIVWGLKSSTANTVTVKNSTASYLQYIVGTNQGGAEHIVVENVTATNMAYLIRPMKVIDVTVKNVTYSGLTFVQVKNSNSSKLAFENVTATTTQAGMPPVTMMAPDTNTASVMYTITLAGKNIVNGAAMTEENESEWFATQTSGLIYEIESLKKPVATIGEEAYETLTAALDAAKAGQTITFVADITEDVTVNKAVAIDGAGKQYTGTMTVNKDLTVTVENVNFVNGGIDKPKAQKSTTGTYTIKNCTFVGEGKYAYPLRFNGAATINVENCSVKNYLYSFLYIASATLNLDINKVTVEDCPNYAVYFASGVNNASIEGLTVMNSNNGILVNNEADRELTIKDCKMENVNTAIAESKGTSAITVNAQGVNDFGTAVLSQYAKCVLAEDATLAATTAGLNVSTNVEGKEVAYQDGKYSVVEKPKAVMIGEQGYETIAAALTAAKAGDVITLTADITEDVTVSKAVTINGAGKTYTGAMILKADATINNLNFDGKGYNGYAVKTRGANYLTIEDCTAKNYGYGFVQVASGTDLVTVKNVTVSDMNYGVKVDYSNAVVLENVKMTNVKNGILNSNYGAKPITIKNSELTTLNIWERNQTTYTTFKFEGKNTVAAFPTSALVEYEGVIVGNNAYGELTDALAEVKADDVLSIHSNYTLDKSINVTGNLTINGNGKTLTYTGSGASARAITVESAANGANLTIKNLTIDCTASYCQRGINYNTTGELVLDGVTVKGKNVTYALNLPGSSDGAQVTINNSSLTANIALNVWGKEAVIAATNSHFTSVDNSTAEGYSAIALNNDGTTAAEGAVVNITGGTITAKDENGNPSNAVRNATATGVINVSDETGVTGNYTRPVAIVTYGTDQFYSCATLQAAIDKAIETKGAVKLIADVTASEIITVNAPVVIDGNGKTVKSTATRAFNIETEGEVVINNLTVNAAERAFNIINKAATVELNDVTATASNNAVMIATSAGAANVTINDCEFTGLAVVNVAGAKSNVAIKNSTINNVDANPAENYGAITVWSSAEEAVVNVENTTITVGDDSKKAYVFPANATVTGVDEVGYIVATVGDAGYDTLEEAIKEVTADGTIELVRNINASKIITINKAVTINGNGVTLTSSAARAINVDGANGVTIKNLTINAKGERAINIIQNATNVTIDNVTATAANYTVNLAGSAAKAVVTIKNSNLTGLNVVNVAAAGSVVTINGGTITCNDQNTNESYAALALNKDAVNGKITAAGDVAFDIKGDSKKASNGAEGGVITIGGVDAGENVVAVIEYEGTDNYNSFNTLADAVAFAKAGQTIKLIANATGAGVVIDKDLTIDFNGKTYTVNEGVGSTGTETLGLQILKDNNVTLKNGTLTSTATVEGSKEVKMLVQNYANLTVEDMNLVDATGLLQYVLSNNSGTVSIEGATNITAAEGNVAFDACKYANYAIPTVTVETTGKITGNIEVTGGNLAIKGGTYTADVTKWCAKGYVCEKNADGSFGVVARKVVKVGDKYYNSLRAAVEAAPAGATVTLLENVTLEGGYADDPDAGLRIEKAIIIKGDGYTVDCGKFTKGIRVYNNSGAKKVVSFYHLTIVNNNANGRCVDTRSGNIDLLLYASTLKATGTSSQPLTLGGSERLYRVRIQATTIDAGKSGYGVIAFVPSWAGITASTESNISGLAAFYLKDGVNGTTLSLDKGTYTGINKYNQNSGAFGTVVVEGDNNTIAVKASNAVVKAVSADGTESADQAAFLVADGATGNKIQLTGEVATEGSQTYLAMVDADVAATTSFTKGGVAMQYVAECGGYKFFALDEAFRFAENNSTIKLLNDVTLDTKNYVTDCDGYASIINVEGKAVTFDLNGKSVTVNANAADLADAKDEMLLAVFSTDEGGNLTLTDSSDDATGSVTVNAGEEAKVYSLVANYTKGCYVTINGGNYYADKLYDSMIYTDANEAVVVNGGKFILSNVGEGSNGKPWIFNVLGQNQRHVTVTGGTFNADVLHQYWVFEVNAPKERALTQNEDGTWTMVDAVAYVTEKYGK